VCVDAGVGGCGWDEVVVVVEWERLVALLLKRDKNPGIRLGSHLSRNQNLCRCLSAKCDGERYKRVCKTVNMTKAIMNRGRQCGR
jgi:hypothetical protein